MLHADPWGQVTCPPWRLARSTRSAGRLRPAGLLMASANTENRQPKRSSGVGSFPSSRETKTHQLLPAWSFRRMALTSNTWLPRRTRSSSCLRRWTMSGPLRCPWWHLPPGNIGDHRGHHAGRPGRVAGALRVVRRLGSSWERLRSWMGTRGLSAGGDRWATYVTQPSPDEDLEDSS